MATRLCAWCSGAMLPRAFPTGRIATYCSERCKRLRELDKRKAALRAKYAAEAECQRCGVLFAVSFKRGAKRRYCSRRCCKLSWDASNAGRNKAYANKHRAKRKATLAGRRIGMMCCECGAEVRGNYRKLPYCSRACYMRRYYRSHKVEMCRYLLAWHADNPHKKHEGWRRWYERNKTGRQGDQWMAYWSKRFGGTIPDELMPMLESLLRWRRSVRLWNKCHELS